LLQTSLSVCLWPVLLDLFAYEPEQLNTGGHTMATKTLYVGNLPYGASENDLRTHFSKYNATNVRIIDGRGFGFVDVDGDLMQAAITDTDKQEFSGRSLNVNEAAPKGSGGGSRSDGYSGGSNRNR
jgi:RNA recognition motif-containing protein